MINIMYLVLMALLALNVSAEVMDAFQTLDKGNLSSIATVDEQINETEASLKELLTDESKEKFRVLEPAIATIRQESENFNTYVEDLRNRLIDESGNNDGEVTIEGDYKESHGVMAPIGKKNKDITTRILVQNENGVAKEGEGEGEVLKQRIIETRQRLIDTYSALLNEYGTERFDLDQAEVDSRIQSVAMNMPFGVGRRRLARGQ